VKVAAIAWLVTATFYFYQYSMRSAPAVMMPELSESFGLSALGVASIVGLFYYGYSPFSLVAGLTMDRFGPRQLLPLAAAIVGLGAFLFATGSPAAASVGRFLQGAGGVFALVGAIYIASKNFPASQAATLIGATQMFGMAGGSAGQFAVGPMISGGLKWNYFWLILGILGIGIAIALYFLLPSEPKKDIYRELDPKPPWLRSRPYLEIRSRSFAGLSLVLLFIPTTIFDMVWGVRFLEDAHGMDYGSAVLRSATVPFGWIIGCPLLGYISDRLGRRKPVIIGGAMLLLVCLALILFGPAGIFPPYVLGLTAGIASGAAMLPYTVIKEVNPPEYSGTATGVVNFINFTFSALLGPVFGWVLQRVSGGAETMALEHFQTAFRPLLYGVVIAVLLALLLKETGPAGKKQSLEEAAT
jgi:MFS family permease